MFSAEVESFYDARVSEAENPLQTAHAIRNTVAHFIPKHNRCQPSLNIALGTGSGNCMARWKMAAKLAERHSGFSILGHFSLWDATEWHEQSDVHVNLVLAAEMMDDFLLVEPNSPEFGGDVRFLARSSTSTEHAHRAILKDQIQRIGRPLGSAAWKNSVLQSMPASSPLENGLGEGSPVPVNSDEPSVILSYADSMRVVRNAAVMQHLLSGNDLPLAA